MGFHQIAEGEPQLGVHDLVAEDVELLEQCLVDLPSSGIGRPPVQLVWPFEQAERSFKQFRSGPDLRLDTAETQVDPFTLPFDRTQLLANLLLGARALGSQVDQVRLLRVESAELCRQLLLKQLAGRLLVLQRLVHHSSHCGDELRCESDRLVVVRNDFLKQIDVEVGLVALLRLAAPTEEVVVDATAALGTLQDHPALTPGAAAGAAPQ